MTRQNTAFLPPPAQLHGRTAWSSRCSHSTPFADGRVSTSIRSSSAPGDAPSTRWASCSNSLPTRHQDASSSSLKWVGPRMWSPTHSATSKLTERDTGWVAMVTGQAFVLFSRLHIVVRRRRTLRLVLAMICVNAVCLHTPTIILTIGSNSAPASTWAPIFNIVERIQLALFCIQEFIISTIYIYCTVQLLGSIYHSRTREVMIELIIINAVCLSMDVVLIGLEYSNNYVGETSVKAMIYAIKLKLEFAVLNQLMNLTRTGLTEGAGHWASGPAARHGQEMPNRSLVTEVDPEAVAARHQARWPSGRRVFGGSFTNKNPKRPIMNPPSRFVGGIARTQRITVTSEPRSPGNVSESHPIHRAKNPFSCDRANPGQGMGRRGGRGQDEQWSPRASQSTETMLPRNPGTDVEEASRA